MVVIPWGRFGPQLRKDLVDASKPESEGGGTGGAEKWWKWCEERVKLYAYVQGKMLEKCFKTRSHRVPYRSPSKADKHVPRGII